MNSLVKAEHKPLRSFVQDEARPALMMLFSAYPDTGDRTAERAQEMSNARVAAYLMGLEGLPGWAVDQAVRDFITGRVDRPAKRRAFMPTVEEVAAQARSHVETEAARQHAEATRREALEHRREVVSPEQRKGVGFRMSLLSMAMERKDVDRMRAAMAGGLPALIALAKEWHVPVPDGLERG